MTAYFLYEFLRFLPRLLLDSILSVSFVSVLVGSVWTLGTWWIGRRDRANETRDQKAATQREISINDSRARERNVLFREGEVRTARSATDAEAAIHALLDANRECFTIVGQRLLDQDSYDEFEDQIDSIAKDVFGREADQWLELYGTAAIELGKRCQVSLHEWGMQRGIDRDINEWARGSVPNDMTGLYPADLASFDARLSRKTQEKFRAAGRNLLTKLRIDSISVLAQLPHHRSSIARSCHALVQRFPDHVRSERLFAAANSWHFALSAMETLQRSEPWQSKFDCETKALLSRAGTAWALKCRMLAWQSKDYVSERAWNSGITFRAAIDETL